MKPSVDLSFLQVLISLVCFVTKSSTGLHKQRIGHVTVLRSQEKLLERHVENRSLREHVANGSDARPNSEARSAKTWTKNQNNGHLLVDNGGNGWKKCAGKSCIGANTNQLKITQINGIRRNTLIRRRRTGSVFLARALDMLDHSRPRDSWNFANRMTSNRPFKLQNFTTHPIKPNQGKNVRLKKPMKFQSGEKRQQWSEPSTGMRPRFFFNTAPAEFVEGPKKRKPQVMPDFQHEAIHISVPGTGGPRLPHLQKLGHPFPLHSHHINMAKSHARFPPFPLNGPFLNLPAPFKSPLHQYDQSPYAVHIHAPPRLEQPAHPDPLGGSMPQLDGPIREEPPPAAFNMMQLPEIATEPFPPTNGPAIHPPDIPPMLPIPEAHDVPPDIPPPPLAGMQNIPPHIPPPLLPPIDVQGMPPPEALGPMLPPTEIQKVPVPVPVPSPPKIEHVPYPVPVPGRPSFQPVMVPVAVPSPPKIHEIPVPVESPPKVTKVPIPVPVAVPSPPQIKHVPYPVAVPVQGPPEVQKIYYPVAVPQPSQVHHVPYPIYLRYPPEIRRVPYPVPSPPKPYPVPVPSPPRVMINRVPFPVVVPQKVPFPVPIVVQHHHIHEGDYEESDSSEDPNFTPMRSNSIDFGDRYDPNDEYPESINTGQCIVNLCRNGGTCSAYLNSYRCHCPKGYKGKHCEEQDMCRPNPCRNFGSCSEVEHDYECTCTKGFIGKNCDRPDPCVPSPCDNGATCSSDGTTYSCTCRIGWMGQNCQVESKCLPINPCQNGGTCTETQGTYKCDCSPGWRGLSCEISAPDTLTDAPLAQAAPCDNCVGPGDVLDERNILRHRPKSSKKWTVLKQKSKEKISL